MEALQSSEDLWKQTDGPYSQNSGGHASGPGNPTAISNTILINKAIAHLHTADLCLSLDSPAHHHIDFLWFYF